MRNFLQFCVTFAVPLMVERLHLPTGDVGSFGLWGCVILGCIDVWLVQLQCSSSTTRHKTSWFLGEVYILQGFVELPWPRFQELHHMKPHRYKTVRKIQLTIHIRRHPQEPNEPTSLGGRWRRDQRVLPSSGQLTHLKIEETLWRKNLNFLTVKKSEKKQYLSSWPKKLAR